MKYGLHPVWQKIVNVVSEKTSNLPLENIEIIKTIEDVQYGEYCSNSKFTQAVSQAIYRVVTNATQMRSRNVLLFWTKDGKLHEGHILTFIP